jgi:hypothetical protein
MAVRYSPESVPRGAIAGDGPGLAQRFVAVGSSVYAVHVLIAQFPGVAHGELVRRACHLDRNRFPRGDLRRTCRRVGARAWVGVLAEFEHGARTVQLS